MKVSYFTRPSFYTPLLLIITFVTLTAAACSSTPTGTTTNTNTANSNAPAASPSVTANANAGNMNGMSDMNHSTMQSSANAANQPYDLQFLDTMISHHQGAVDMARPAASKAEHAELKEFARKIIEDQEREIAQMKQWREQWYAGKPQAMNMEMPGMRDSMKGMDMNRLNTATGNDYDLMFIDMMTPHHAGATAMAREALTKAEHPEIKRIAQTIITAQEREIAQMNRWKSVWNSAKKTPTSAGNSNSGNSNAVR